MSETVEVEEMTQEQYNEARQAGEVDETGHAVESDELNDEPDTYVKPADEPKKEEEAKEAPKRPWKIGEDGTQGGIPNARFAATRIELREKDQALKEAHAQLAQFQRPAEQEITDPNQLDRSKFVDASGEFDGPAYLAAREAIVRNQAVAEVEHRMQVKEREREVASLVSNYAAAVNEEAKTNPEIIEAVRHLDQFGPAMHPAIATMLMRLPPAVSFEIACNEEYIAQIINGDPAESLALLGEIKASVKARKSEPKQETALPKVAAFKPQAAPPKHVPRTVGGGGTARKDPDQMTQQEYSAYRLREMRR